MRAAGILFVTPDRKALFLERAPGGDHVGEWCFPGGGVEEGETLEAAAERECKEETGWLPDGRRAIWTRQINGEVDFTTFLQRLTIPFIPHLNKESTGYAWAPIDRPPQPLHPGCNIALRRFGMDELDIARSMVSGELASPQRYENIILFDVRITGTGTAYRKKLDEWVYRRPENYLSEEFLARCNGLPFIIHHPPSNTLNTQEFRDRVTGSVFLPYIGDGQRHSKDEVWGIVKVWDKDAALWMEHNQLSTSPAVVFRPFFPDEPINTTAEMSDGSTLLIEGDPTLIDHLAICEQGVWDKLNEPAGIVTTAVEPARADSQEEDNRLKQINRKLLLLRARMSTLAHRQRNHQEMRR